MSTSSTYNSLAGVGAIQGILLYLLHYTQDNQIWPTEWGLSFNAILFLTIFLPVVYYWAQDTFEFGGVIRLILLAGVLIAGIVSWQAITVFPIQAAPSPQLVSPATFIGLFLVCFMLVPLVTVRATTKNGTLWYWDYQRLFELSWRNAVVSAQAGLLTGLFWAVLLLGAQLFHLIGIEKPKELLLEPWVGIPLTTLCFSLAYRAGLLRPDFASAVRIQWLSITSWLLPLTSLIGAAFVLASAGGVEDLFEQGLSAFFLLWFAAFWVCFYNSAYQDGQASPNLPLLLHKVLPWFALALLGVVGMAAWALAIRIRQYGLTPDRIWGIVVVLVALAYAIGYLWPRQQETGKWMPQIAPTNVIAALLMTSSILLLLSPVLDVRQLTVNSQLARLEDGRVTPGKFDVDSLTSLGRSGHDALKDLIARRTEGKAQELLALRAEDALTRATRIAQNESVNDDLSKIPLQGRLEVYPAGSTLPPGLLEALKKDLPNESSSLHSHHCLRRALPCPLLFIDLNRDGVNEALLWEMSTAFRATLYEQNQGQWQRVGQVRQFGGGQNMPSELLADGDYKIVESPWDGLKLGEYHYQVFEDADEAEPAP